MDRAASTAVVTGVRSTRTPMVVARGIANAILEIGVRSTNARACIPRSQTGLDWIAAGREGRHRDRGCKPYRLLDAAIRPHDLDEGWA